VNAGTDCAKGTFNGGKGMRVATECNECPPGYICDELGLLFVDDADTVATELFIFGSKECPATYYCEQGTDDTSALLNCPSGRFCAGGNMEGHPCVPGEYAEGESNIECTTCDMGYYCPYEESDILDVSYDALGS
jgi:hypothetical protein